MNCPRESEVLDALTTARWPDEVRAHVDACATCGELVVVTNAFREELLATAREANVPPSGLVWWRMQRREREEAARVASRAITFVQASSILGSIALALTIAGGLSGMSDKWLAWIGHTATFASGIPLLPLIVTAAASLLLAPVVLWFVFAEE
jgi:hypothetical protein